MQKKKKKKYCRHIWDEYSETWHDCQGDHKYLGERCRKCGKERTVK